MADVYEGSEPYIFVNYSHEDSEIALPVVGALQRAGYRVWYDVGIKAGYEWFEFIAKHVDACSCMLVLLTPSLAKSRSCRTVMDYAFNQDKQMLLVYLKDIELTPGMRMQFGLTQAIRLSDYPTQDDFIAAMLKVDILKPCLSEAATDDSEMTHRFDDASENERTRVKPEPELHSSKPDDKGEPKAPGTRYLNPGSGSFRIAIRSEIYVDKTEVIGYLNTLIESAQRYVSVSRPRRFGKTMAADMLCAYYGRGTDARELFEGMKLASGSSAGEGGLPWDAYLGKFDVIRVTMTDFLGQGAPVPDSLRRMEELVSAEIRMAHPGAAFMGKPSLPMDMQSAFNADGTRFVVVIDEWDAPMRERRDDEEGQRAYLDFLRNWLKDKEWLALAYITGILPIKKYGMHSALNMFSEYSMVSPKGLAEFAGFTADEVREICDQRRLDFNAMCEWYDGYRLTDAPSRELVLDYDPEVDARTYRVFNPLSVVSAARYRRLESYWSHTETYRALEEYIRMDFDGMREAVALLMDGGRIRANLGTYQNDMKSFRSRDDVFALLVHLGYLGWDEDAGEAFIPNREVRQVFLDSTRTVDWDLAFREFERSKELVEATWRMDESRVADLLEAAHDQADNKGYNSEAALSFAVQMAYYAAHKWYTKLLELDSGKGYADIAYLPAPRHPEKPALIIELKHGKSPQEALDQIRDRNYLGRLGHYADNALLVGISYDPDVKAGDPEYKRHHCKIERA